MILQWFIHLKNHRTACVLQPPASLPFSQSRAIWCHSLLWPGQAKEAAVHPRPKLSSDFPYPAGESVVQGSQFLHTDSHCSRHTCSFLHTPLNLVMDSRNGPYAIWTISLKALSLLNTSVAAARTGVAKVERLAALQGMLLMKQAVSGQNRSGLTKGFKLLKLWTVCRHNGSVKSKLIRDKYHSSNHVKESCHRTFFSAP